MVWKAGDKITAARLSLDSNSTLLTDTTTFTVAAGYEQWGTEEITFDQPDVAVKVLAWLSGRLSNSVDADSEANVRVGISFDGGSTYTYGNTPQLNVGTGGSQRTTTSVLHHRSGIPTGDVVIRAEVDVFDADVDARSGIIMASLVPQ